jgi:hypothetical protein
MAVATALLQNRRVRTARLKAYNGQALKIDPTKGIQGFRSARNAGFSTAQVSQVVFAAPGTLPVGAEVFVTITEADCTAKQLRLHSCDTTAATPLTTLLIEAINGVEAPPLVAGNPSTIIPTSAMHGYSAELDAAANTVNITGKAGVAFTISYGAFGYTVNGIANPATPTTVLVTSASCAAPIHVGCAIVNNVALAATSHPEFSSAGSSIDAEYDSLASLPTGAATERFLGWVLREEQGEIKIQECCETLDCADDIPCYGCLHYVETRVGVSDVALHLEQFPAGTTVPASIVGLPIHYRRAAEPGYTKIGAPALSLAAVANANLEVAKNKSTDAQWIVLEILDAATYLVRAGVAK